MKDFYKENKLLTILGAVNLILLAVLVIALINLNASNLESVSVSDDSNLIAAVNMYNSNLANGGCDQLISRINLEFALNTNSKYFDIDFTLTDAESGECIIDFINNENRIIVSAVASPEELFTPITEGIMFFHQRIFGVPVSTEYSCQTSLNSAINEFNTIIISYDLSDDDIECIEIKEFERELAYQISRRQTELLSNYLNENSLQLVDILEDRELNEHLDFYRNYLRSF